MSNQKSSIFIDLITQYKNQGAKDAQKSLGDLGSLASDLGKKLAGAFSVVAIEQFAQKSIDAFKNEQVAVDALNVSLGNLGTSYEKIAPVVDQTVNGFVDLGFKSSETLTAFDKLTTALSDPKKALEALNTTADLARYKNQDLVTTALQVAKATAGNSRAFADLGLKIDKTLTPQNAFNKLMTEAKDKVGGLAKSYSSTLAGSMDVASAKIDKAQVNLGQKLAPAVKQLADFTTKYLAPAINWVADNIGVLSAFAGALGAVALGMKAVGIAAEIMAGELAINPIFAAISAIALLVLAFKDIGAGNNPNTLTFGTNVASSTASTGTPFDPTNLPSITGKKKVVTAQANTKAILTEAQKLKAAQDELTRVSLDNAKKLAAADAKTISDAQKKIALDKAALALKQASKAIDMNAIEIQAALIAGKDKLSTQDQNVLELQKALIDNNDSAATQLSQTILKANGYAYDLNGNIQQIKSPPSPLQSLLDDLTAGKITLDQMVAAFEKLKSGGMTAASLGLTPAAAPAQTVAQQIADYSQATSTALTQQLQGSGLSDSSVAALSASSANYAGQYAQYAASQQNPTTNNFTISIGGQTISDFIVTQNQNASASGYQITTSRLNPAALGGP